MKQCGLEADVGRPLSDIKSDLEGEDLLVKAKTVLETLVPIECEVRNGSGLWFLARLRPYRTYENVIEGVAASSMRSTPCDGISASSVSR